MGILELSFWKRSPRRKLPTGAIEISRADCGNVMISFLGDDGDFHWFKFGEDGAAERLGARLIEVARTT